MTARTIKHKEEKQCVGRPHSTVRSIVWVPRILKGFTESHGSPPGGGWLRGRMFIVIPQLQITRRSSH